MESTQSTHTPHLQPGGVISTPAGESIAAVGEVLIAVSQAMLTMRSLMLAAMDAEDGDQTAILQASAELASITGLLADRASRACTGMPGVLSDDQWLYPPTVAQALKTLEGCPPRGSKSHDAILTQALKTAGVSPAARG